MIWCDNLALLGSWPYLCMVIMTDVSHCSGNACVSDVLLYSFKRNLKTYSSAFFCMVYVISSFPGIVSLVVLRQPINSIDLLYLPLILMDCKNNLNEIQNEPVIDIAMGDFRFCVLLNKVLNQFKGVTIHTYIFK